MSLSAKPLMILDDYEHSCLLPKERRRMLNNRFYFKVGLKDYKQRYQYSVSVQHWCHENCTDFFYIRYKDSDLYEFTVYFLEPNDAVHFKLYWAGKPEAAQ